MTERVPEVDRAFSANGFFLTKTWGVAPRLEVKTAPLAPQILCLCSVDRVEATDYDLR
jgi:hypothetical protein